MGKKNRKNKTRESIYVISRKCNSSAQKPEYKIKAQRRRGDWNQAMKVTKDVLKVAEQAANIYATAKIGGGLGSLAAGGGAKLAGAGAAKAAAGGGSKIAAGISSKSR